MTFGRAVHEDWTTFEYSFDYKYSTILRLETVDPIHHLYPRVSRSTGGRSFLFYGARTFSDEIHAHSMCVAPTMGTH